MDYKRIYLALIEKARNRFNPEGYFEIHHILPRCLGGNDDEQNLVKLTPEEHYVAHQLLVKIYPNNNKLILAATMMIPNRKSNKLYGWLKRKHSIAMKELQTGTSNSQFGTRWIHNDKLKISKKIKSNEHLPIGWKEGRRINFLDKIEQCDFCNNEFIKKSNSCYCSEKCKTYKLHNSIFIIDSNLDDIINKFLVTGSITAVLQEYGLTGRKGNSYLSSILKSKNIKVLKRRNS